MDININLRVGGEIRLPDLALLLRANNTQETPTPAPAAPAVVAPKSEPVKSAPTVPVAPVAVSAPPAPPAPAEAAVTQEALSRCCVALVRKGLSEQLNALLPKFKIASLNELPKERYNDFAADLRALGGEI